MRYWVYISDKVEGPFEEEKLVTLQGFTPDTLICAEDAANSGNQEWAKASSVFEFDQVPAAAPAEAAPAQTQHAQPAASASAADESLAALLLGKLDALTAQISGMQTKLDGMQTKLEEAVTAAQQARENTRPADAYVPPQEDAHSNTITLTQHDLTPEVNEDALITNTASLVSQAENLVAAANTPQEQPVDMLGPVDLGDSVEGDLSGEEAVLSSAMDSLYNAQVVEQTQEEKESTFQDLLTPAQAQALAAQAEALKKETAQLDGALKAAEEAPAVDEAAKEAFVSEFTVSAEPQENVLDQVIKEKQEEQEEKKSNTLKLAAGAAAIAAGAAALAAMGDKKEEQNEETVQPLNFEENDVPALSIAPDAKQPEVTEEVLPAAQMPADEPVQAAQPVQTAADGIPSLDDMGVKDAVFEEQDKKEATLQELVPGAKTEQPEGVIITDADLKDAFTERAQNEQSVEQLFGINPAQHQQAPVQTPVEDQAIPSLDSIGQQTADQPLPVANPNDLTEIELKEGSTYLISDFVPPAQTDNSLPKELTDLQFNNPAASAQPEKAADAFTEIVSSTQQAPEPTAQESAASQETVSQVILENTIKSKRGATLDIKTVPMVPEPAQSERLQIEGLDDDINAQHDLKAADLKPAGKTKMVMGVLVALILAALIYGMLAFMNLIPAQFNLLASNKAQAEQMAARQDQMNEMLYDEPQTVEPTTLPQQQAAVNPMDAALAEVQSYPLVNGFTLKEFIEAKHPAAQALITWDISTAVDPDNYSVLVKVPPENPQSFKISYRFNYNTVTKALDPTISDAKNLLDSANQGAM